MASKATMAAASMIPASAARGDEARTAEAFTDPLGKYPKPPFKKQSQPWPGLASQVGPLSAMAAIVDVLENRSNAFVRHAR